MDKNTDFENIVISFARPDTGISDYAFLKQPDDVLGGGLRSQVVVSVKEVSLSKLIFDFCGVTDLAMNLTCKTGGLLIAAVITASLDLLSVKSFPDEYSQLLSLLKKSPRGTIVNWQEMDKLLKNDPSLDTVLDALVKEDFLAKKSDGRYIIKRKILMRCECHF